ncbi:MAG TPA: hypothetical protein VGL76_12350 [Gaiellaceae bacterium]|jgi:hypothetical protein
MRLLAACTGGALALGAATAQASTMHPVLGAKLAGMGESGVVNLQVKSHDLCWTFDVPTKGITAASIRDSGGMVVTKLGSAYSKKSCAMVSTKALQLIDAKPGSFMVWLDTKGHPGDLRGKLFAGMAHTSHM